MDVIEVNTDRIFIFGRTIPLKIHLLMITRWGDWLQGSLWFQKQQQLCWLMIWIWICTWFVLKHI